MKSTCFYLCVVVGVFGIARATQANTFASATSSAFAFQNNPPNTPVTFSQNFHDEDISAASAGSAAVAINTIGASTVGTAKATYGDIGLTARANVNGGSDQLQSGGEAQTTLEASWEDRIVVTVPLLPRGDTIKIHGLLNIAGFLSSGTATGPIRLPGFTTAGQINGSFKVSTFNNTGSVNTGPGCVCAERTLAPINSPPTDISTNDVSNSFVEWGMPNDIGSTVTVSAKLFVKATAGASAVASILGDFGGSIHWGGIESVRNATTGEVYTDWTVTSDSGFDYSRPFPVPEPSSLLLLMMGLWASVSGRRRMA
jgi:hypothetical protein